MWVNKIDEHVRALEQNAVLRVDHGRNISSEADERIGKVEDRQDTVIMRMDQMDQHLTHIDDAQQRQDIMLGRIGQKIGTH